VPVEAAGRLEKAVSRKSNMYGGGESDGCVVPWKCPNNGGQPPAEGTEGRQPTQENIGQATALRTQSRIGELSDLLGVRKAARKDKRTRFTALPHHVTRQSAAGRLLRPEARSCSGSRWRFVAGVRDGSG
jgi:RNA-directed DNA polymerase